MLTTYHLLALRLGVTGVLPLLLGMDRDNFTLYIYIYKMQMCDGIVYEAQRNSKEILEISVWSRSDGQTCSFQMVEVF